MATFTDIFQRTATTIIFDPLLGLWKSLLQAVCFILPFARMPIFKRGIEWSLNDIPTLEGKIAIVTGSNSGIGFETARALASAQATVILAVRNERKGFEAKNKILRSFKCHAHIQVMKLDLSSLASIKEFATKFTKQFGALDILVNNAGVMNPPGRKTTEDGFELQFGTNHLGHFALTARLMSVLRKRPSRVVNVSSLAAHQGTVNFDDLMFNKRPVGWEAYAQSKLANLLFTQELNRRSTKEGWEVMSVAAHPGLCSSTEIVNNGAGEISFLNFFNICLGKIFLPSAKTSIIPVLYAATSEGVRGGEYYGPKNLFEIRDGLSVALIPSEATKKDIAEKLWIVSSRLTQVGFMASEN